MKGKKVRSRRESASEASGEDDHAVLDVFRRSFEQQFGAIDSTPVVSRSQDQSQSNDTLDSEDDGSSQYSENSDSDDPFGSEEFTGFDDNSPLDNASSEDEAPQVVKFVDSRSNGLDTMTKREKKRFMSASAPRKAPAVEPTTKAGKKEDDENLQNDVALQRLISESHILAEANKGHMFGADISTDVDLDPIGKSRLKALDARLQQATGKKRAEQKMPMAMRRGIEQHRREKQQKHEEYAKEAGIVLARPAKSSGPSKVVKRDRGLKINAVGRNTRHGLIVSKAEIAKYTSGASSGRKGGKRGRR